MISPLSNKLHGYVEKERATLKGGSFFVSLLQFDNVGPAGSWVWTFEIVLDGIGEDVGFELRSSLLTLGRIQASLILLSLNRSLAHHFLAYILL